jgi:N4-(beta-N-acetylglucosaminyl)-L-asparaginase
MSPEKACYEAVQRIIKRSPEKAKQIQVGFLALNKNGEYGAYALQKGFSYALRDTNNNKMADSKSVY